jgi:class 3 adenylate cyclase
LLLEVGITTNGTSGTAERRVVTALFADLVGSTPIAETMDPEDWTDLVNRVVGEMASSIERYAGTVHPLSGALGRFEPPTPGSKNQVSTLR